MCTQTPGRESSAQCAPKVFMTWLKKVFGAEEGDTSTWGVRTWLTAASGIKISTATNAAGAH